MPAERKPARDGRLVHCGVNLDTSANNSLASVDSGLDRARDRKEVIELYSHHAGVSVPIDKIEHVLANLPVQQVTKVELIINLKIAKALGISMPLALLGRADAIIE